MITHDLMGNTTVSAAGSYRIDFHATTGSGDDFELKDPSTDVLELRNYDVAGAGACHSSDVTFAFYADDGVTFRCEGGGADLVRWTTGTGTSPPAHASIDADNIVQLTEGYLGLPILTTPPATATEGQMFWYEDTIGTALRLRLGIYLNGGWRYSIAVS